MRRPWRTPASTLAAVAHAIALGALAVGANLIRAFEEPRPSG